MQETHKQREIERIVDVYLLLTKERRLWSGQGLYTKKIEKHQELRIVDQAKNQKDPSLRKSDAWQRCHVCLIRKKVDRFHSRLPTADESGR